MVAALAIMVAALAIMVAPRAPMVASMSRMDVSMGDMGASMARIDASMARQVAHGAHCGRPIRGAWPSWSAPSRQRNAAFPFRNRNLAQFDSQKSDLRLYRDLRDSATAFFEILNFLIFLRFS